MSSALVPVLPEGAGYGVVVGIGLFFALMMAFVSYIQVYYSKRDMCRRMADVDRIDIHNTPPREVRSSTLPVAVSSRG